MSEKTTFWKQLFTRWPASIPKLGIVITPLNEGIPFNNFFVSDLGVLLERDRPDNSGARSAIVPWEEIITLKLTSPIETARFAELGFRSVG